MIKHLKENFNITNDCIILATPMILFFISIQWFTETFRYSLNDNASFLIFFITLWIWISGCFAGWFYMVKKTLQFSKKTFLFDTDRNTALLKLLSCLFKGVGKFFFSFLVLILFYFCIKIVKIILLFYLYSLNTSINYTFLITILNLIIVFFAAYLVIYAIPEIIYNYINPFRAIINSCKKSFISFKQTLPTYILLCIASIAMYIAISFSINYPILYFIMLIFLYYFILYSVLLIFRLYEQNFIK